MTATSGHLPVLGPWPARMANPILDDDWGSTTQLARLQGRLPTGRPEAEVWMGAHPGHSSALIGLDGTLQPLDRLLERHPQTLLGADVLARHGARLPYLLKVFAVARPLPVTVHPEPGRGRTGAGADAGAGAGAGAGSNVDPSATSELLYALRPVDVLAGFRNATQALDLLRRLDSARLSPLVDALNGVGADVPGPARAFALLLGWPDDDRANLVDDLVRQSRRLLRAPQEGDGLSPAQRRTLIWTSRLAGLYPEDPLAAAPLLLDVVQLSPGSTLFLPPGVPHAYLAGLGVEVRAGRLDAEQPPDSGARADAGTEPGPTTSADWLEVAAVAGHPVRDVPEIQLGPCEVAWRPAVEEFQLSRLRLVGSTPIACYPRLRGPQVVLCTAGTVGVATSAYALALRPGESAFVGASGGPITLAGPGEVFRVAVGEPLA